MITLKIFTKLLQITLISFGQFRSRWFEDIPTLKRIKIFLGVAINQDKLNTLAMISV